MSLTMDIIRKIEATYWSGPDDPLPEGWHDAMPEICWSAGRELVYFTYGKLRPQHWLGVAKAPIPEHSPKGMLDEGCVTYDPSRAGLTGEPYARKCLSFTFWKVKSEASMNQNHRAMFLDHKDEAQVSLWYDYCSMEQWPNPLPRWAEFREVGGKYGRGYRPYYVAPGEWLVKDRSPDGAALYTVMSDEDLQKLRAQ